MRRLAALALGLTAAALVTYGLLQPVTHEVNWVVAIWLAAPLALAGIRLAQPSGPRGIQRSVHNLGLVVAVGFCMIALQLLRQQVIHADETASMIYVDDQGLTTSNIRLVRESLRTLRGRMIDRNGVVLADATTVEGGFALRSYPIGEQYDMRAFGGVLGFFSHRYGASGLEATYDAYLSGSRESLRRIQDGLLGRQHVGDNLQLTLDARLQAAAYAALGERIGSVVVLDPRTGAVLAMASYPGFDPRGFAFNPTADESQNVQIENFWAQLNSEGAGQPLLNRPTQSRYPPGSTFKAVTAIGALEHPREGRPAQIDCPNERETEAGAPPVVNAVPDLFTRTGDPSDLERVFAFSCNTAFAEYAMRLGSKLMIETARAFDIYTPEQAPDTYAEFTDLPTVPSILYVDPGFLDRRPALADTGYGQGQLLVTPLQMAMVAAAVANDGVMMQPYLVERVLRGDGSVVAAHSARSIRRAMSRQTAQQMLRNFRAAVEYGFGRAAGNVPGVRVGGKSGTAEFPCPTPDNPGRICTHAWFIAVAPIERGEVAVAVMLEGGGEGSGAGAQLAGEVLAAALAP